MERKNEIKESCGSDCDGHQSDGLRCKRSNFQIKTKDIIGLIDIQFCDQSLKSTIKNK